MTEGGKRKRRKEGGRQQRWWLFWKMGEWERREADLGIVTPSLLLLSSPDPWLKEAGVQNHGVATDSPDFTTLVTAPARSKHPLPVIPKKSF